MSETRPTVLVAIKGLGIGGAERLVAEGARHWDADSFDYHVAYSLPWKNQLVGELEQAGVPVHLIGGKRGLITTALAGIRSLIEQTHTRLVHAHLPSMGIIARLASPVPVVYTEHNLVGSYRPISRWANWLTYQRNSAVMTVSEEVARSIAGYPGPSPVVVPNGVTGGFSRTPSNDVRQELGLSPEIPLIVHVGNIRPHKGHSNLIAAAARLETMGVKAAWVSIGGEKHDGDLKRVRNEAAETGVSTVRFLGRREDALRFIAAADVFVSPSDFEGMPLSVMEAMAAGTPVVATAVGGVPELIQNGVTGLLVQPGDADSLARAVSAMLEDRAMARACAASARQLVENTYGLERMVRAQEDIYRSVLDA